MIAENEKLINYKFFENLTRLIDDLFFSFLMCEFKCDNEVFDYVNSQNMHNCIVTIKTFFKLEQKTNQYRKNKQFEILLDNLIETASLSLFFE